MKATEINLILCEMEAGKITRIEALDKLCVLFSVVCSSGLNNEICQILK